MKVFDRIAHWTQVRIRWMTIVVKRIVRFVTHDMWYLNMDDLSRWKKRGVEDLKTVFVMLKVFSDQKIGYQITALAYQSMMSVVPFIAIGLYLTNGIGIADQFSAFLLAGSKPGPEKIKKAESLGVPILDEEAFRKLLPDSSVASLPQNDNETELTLF